MMVKQTEIEHLKSVERMLAREQPFGDHVYIDSQSWLHYESRLKMLAEHVREGEQTLRAFRQASRASRYRVMGDPVVRSSINTALSYFKLRGPEVDVAETKGVLEVATKQLRDNSRVGPLAMGAGGAKRLGRALHHGWIWKDERDEDIAAKSFRKLFNQHIGQAKQLGLWTPDRQAEEVLRQGANLLRELLPRLARSALSHAHVIVIGRAPFPITSVTNPSIPGAVFFAPFILKHPWRAAEFLLHEALHLKFIDLEHTHTMLRRGYNIYRSPRIEALWNRSQRNASNKWPVNRALTVAHTYTCLALFFRMVEARASELERIYGPIQDLDPALSAQRSLDRAHYLALKLEEVKNELGHAGRGFVEWILKLLSEMNPHPRRAGLCAHLSLDLYDRETQQIHALIAGAGPERSPKLKGSASELSRLSTKEIIVDLVQRDLSASKDLLPAKRIKLNRAAFSKLNGATPVAIAAEVSRVRSEISATAGALLIDARRPVNVVNRNVGALVKGSGKHIDALFKRLSS